MGNAIGEIVCQSVKILADRVIAAGAAACWLVYNHMQCVVQCICLGS